ncbi:Protein fam72a [Coemansia sp. RSA 2599]|nr:Protein fam72a [Coemansia sp. RSA 2598]KAJ1828816.1 Protein fam72a [Coemansia sp. RSA 2599]
MARPAIRCFSTDLPPLGCDIVCQPVAPPISEMIVDSGCSTCSSITHHARRFDLAPSGPCDCHVQDIACLGCGNIVGYYIHRPCFRCLAQRLRIKQRGFQHLWTFYQDNVVAVQRENEYGEPVGWEELPVPPAPTATAIRPTTQSENNRYQRSISEVIGVDDDAARRSQRLMYVSQRVNRDSRQNTARSLASSLAETAAQSSASARDPTPMRPSTRTVLMGSSSSSSSPATTPGSSGTVTPGATDPALVSAATRRRDEVMEPLCPPKPKYGRTAPPAGLSNWLFQVGLDCMVKWEEGTLSR